MTLPQLLAEMKKHYDDAPIDIAGPNTVKLTIEHKPTIQFVRHAIHDMPRLIAALEKAIEQRDNYLYRYVNMIDRVPEQFQRAKDHENTELLRILQGEP